MSGLIGLTPVVRLKLENLLMERSYPEVGYVEGIIDTGYQGFVAVPIDVFTSLSMPSLKTASRRVQLADGTKLKSEVGQGTAAVAGLGEVDGSIETVPGLAEILVGTQFLSRFRLDLDYCLHRTALSTCR